MHFRTQHHYDADPARVYAMLTDAGFLDGLFGSEEKVTHQVSIDGGHTVLRADTPAPAQAAKFADSMSITMDIAWGSPAPDGSRRGPLSVTISKVPASVAGTAAIAPDATGTTVTYEGEFTVRIPLVGHKMEQSALPYITKGLDAEQRLGAAWLAAH